MAATLVLLHPFPLDASFWTPLRKALPADACVMAPDFPGLGRAAGESATIREAADRVAEAIGALGRGPAVVCGLSMGGYVALALAAHHPGSVAGLVLANTRAEADDPPTRTARGRVIARIEAGGLDGFLDGMVDALVSVEGNPDAHARARCIAAGQTPAGVIGALRALRDRPDRRGDLPGVSVPTTVVWGEEDRITPRAAARDLASGIAGARLIEIPGAGHLTALERPRAFAEIVGAVLAEAQE